MAEPGASSRRRSGRSGQIKQLQEENQSLRRTLREAQRRSQANEHRSVDDVIKLHKRITASDEPASAKWLQW